MSSRRVFVLGGKTLKFIGKGNPDFIHPKHPLFGKKTNPGLKEYITDLTKQILSEQKIKPSQLDKAIVGNFIGELMCNQGHLGAGIANADPALIGVPSLRVEGACASGGLAIDCGVHSIKSGMDIVYVMGLEVQNTVSARLGGDYLARAADYDRERKIDDFTFPAMFAARKKAYCGKFKNVKPDDFDRISLKAYANGNLNPLAHMHKVKMTPEQCIKSPKFLGNKDLKAWLKVSDCSQVSDGASGLVLVSEEGLKKLGRDTSDCIEMLYCGVNTGNLYAEEVDMTRLKQVETGGKRAYKACGITAKNIDVAEIHDCFNVAEVMASEALGFAKYGEGVFLESGINSKVPINTGGGLVSFGHPVGATGVKQVMEIYRQMKGQCDKYQIKKSLELGITSNMGGNDKTVVTTILKNL